MPFRSTKPSELCPFDEVTQGTPPPNAAAWQSETRIRHLAESLDVSGIQQAVVEDMRSQLRRYNKEIKVKGLRNVEFPFQLYGTGSGVTTTDASQIAQIPLGAQLSHCLGGEHLSNSTTATVGGAHTATAIELDATTNIAVGCLIAWEHPTTGECHVRRVTDLTGAVATLDQALPISAADGDPVHAMATYYIDPDVLEDSSAGPYTRSWFIRKGGEGSDIAYVVRGCKSALTSINLTRGELPILEFNTMVASYTGPGNADTPDPTWASAPSGLAPTAIAPRTTVFLGDYGSTTSTEVHAHEVSIDPGVPVARIESQTEVDDNMEGTAGYTGPDADTLITLVLGPHNTDFLDDFDADTFKVFRWYKRDSAGNLFSVTCSRCEVVESPSPAAAPGDVWGQRIVLRAHEDLDAVGTTDLIKSKILIGIG